MALGAGSAPMILKAQQPNILFIYSDDQLEHENNFFPEGQVDGVPKNYTPTMDSLWQNGVAYPYFYLSSPASTPSRYTTLTGQYASRDVVPYSIDDSIARVQWNTYIDVDDEHTASILQRNGYFTGFVGKNHSYEVTKNTYLPAHGVDENSDPTDPAVIAELVAFQENICNDFMMNHEFDYAGGVICGNITEMHLPLELQVHNLDWKVSKAIEFFNQAHDSGKPFFLHFATNITHVPDKGGLAHTRNPLATPIGYLSEPLNVMPPRDSITAWAANPATADVTWLDFGVKSMIDSLDALGMLDNTIIFYFNDNNDGEGKSTVYESGARTFGFIAGNYQGQKGIYYSPVMNVDMLPTILELAQVPKNEWPATLDGVSITPTFTDKDTKVRETVYIEMGLMRGIIKDGYKYVSYRKPAEWSPEWYHLVIEEGGNYVERRAAAFYPSYWEDDQLYQVYNPVNTISPIGSEQEDLVDSAEFAQILVDLQSELRVYLNDLPGKYAELTHPIAPVSSSVIDAYVDENNVDINYGSVEGLSVGNGKEAYLQYNIEGFADIDTTIKSVTLRFYYSGQDISELVVYSVADNSWEEGLITNTTKPTKGNAIDTIINITTNRWYAFDVTDVVSADGSYSFVIGTSETAEGAISSKESSKVSMLEVNLVSSYTKPEEGLVEQEYTFPVVYEDFEDGDMTTLLGGPWFTYTDIYNGGFSTESLEFLDGGLEGSSLSAKFSYSLDAGTYSGIPFVGMGSNADAIAGVTKNFFGSDGISVMHKGSGFNLQISFPENIATPPNYDNYYYSVPDHTEWTEVKLTWSQFEQEGWGTRIVFDESKINGVKFAVKGNTGDSGEVWLDNITIWEEGVVDPEPTSIANVEVSTKAYPNPCVDKVVVISSEEINRVTISTLLGEELITSSSESINVSELAAGSYVLQVYLENGTTTTQIITKK